MKGQNGAWDLVYENTLNGSDCSLKAVNANAGAVTLGQTWSFHDDVTCKNHDKQYLMDLDDDALEYSGVDYANDDELLNGSHQTAATWEDHPHDASVDSCREIHAGKAMEMTWVKFYQSWSLQD